MAAGAYTISREFDFSHTLVTEVLPPIMVEGNENAHQIVITCMDGGEAADLSELSCRGVIVNSNRHTYQLEASIDGNAVTIPLGQSAYLTDGPLVVMVELYKTGLSMTIYRAETTVQTGATDALYDPDDLLPTVSELMAQAAAYQASLQAIINDTAAAKEDAESAAEDVQEFMETLTDANGLVRPLATNFMRAGKNIFDKAAVTHGHYLSYGNGALISHSGYFTSDYMGVIALADYKPNQTETGGGGAYCWYNAGKTFIGGNTISSVGSGCVTAPANAAYLRVSYANAKLDILQVEAGEESTAYEAYYESLKLENAEEISAAFEAYLPKAYRQNLYDYSNATTGCFVYSGGQLISNAAYAASDYLGIYGLPSIYIKNNSASGGTYTAFYDAAKVILSAVVSSAGSVVPVPDGAYYCRVSLVLDTYAKAAVYPGYVALNYEAARLVLNEDTLPIRQTEIILPDTLYHARGTECNLFFDNIAPVLPRLYAGYAEGDADVYRRFLRIGAGESAGDRTLYLYLIDRYLNTAAQKKIMVKTLDPATLSGQTVKLLCVGDSFTAGGYWCHALYENLTAMGITPVFIGTNQDISTPDVTIDGVTYTLNREAKSGGTLSQFVTNTAYNPWWNSGTGENDIAGYLTDNGLDTPDIMIAMFGWNDLPAYRAADYDSMIDRIKLLAGAFHAANASGKFVYMIQPQGAIDYCNYNTPMKQAALLAFARALYAEFDGTGDYSFVTILPAYAWVDRENGYTKYDLPFQRGGATESVAAYLGTASSYTIHPSAYGEQQIGDCATGLIVAHML